MNAVYESVRQKAMRRQAGGFATMHGEPAVHVTIPEYSSSSLKQYVGSAFVSGAVMLYALHEEPHVMGDRAGIFPVSGASLFPLLGETNTSTMSIGGPWVSSEPEAYNSEIVRLPWKRKVIRSGRIQLRTAELPRRKPRTIIGDYLADEGYG